MPNPDRLAFRPCEEDQRWLRVIASHLQHTRGTPFVSPADALRAGLRIAAEKIAADNRTAAR